MQGDLVELVRAELLQNGTDKWKQAQLRFHKDAVQGHGVSISEVREIAKRFTPAWKSLPHTQRLDVCDALRASGFSKAQRAWRQAPNIAGTRKSLAAGSPFCAYS